MNTSAVQRRLTTDRLRARSAGGGGCLPQPLSPIANNMPLPVIDSPTLKPVVPSRRSISELLAPLDQIAANSPNLVANHGAQFESSGQTYELPRYLFIGSKGGDDPIRLGIFAGLHGDEPEGVHALIQFLNMLEREPELAAGYCLFIYPVCNPTGFEDRTRNARG